MHQCVEHVPGSDFVGGDQQNAIASAAIDSECLGVRKAMVDGCMSGGSGHWSGAVCRGRLPRVPVAEVVAVTGAAVVFWGVTERRCRGEVQWLRWLP